MIDESFREELTKFANESIIEQARKNTFIGSKENLNTIAGFTSGSIRLFPAAIRKFKLILSQPLNSAFNPFEIRCVLCNHVISYPCWYYEVKYAVNHFHYFICFDSSSSDKPSTKCYRKSI